MHALLDTFTAEEKDKILTDLFICLDQGRLVDSAMGWELTKGGKGVRPIPTIGGFRMSAQYPSWMSLKGRFPQHEFLEMRSSDGEN